MKAINHITLLCKNIENSADLFCDLFGAKVVYSSEIKSFSLSKEKFILIGTLWIALMEGSPIERSYNHIAFSIDEKDLALYETKIKTWKLDILPGRPRDPREGKSIYFYDFDNHLFELHTSDLQTRLAFYQESEGRIKNTF